MSILPPAGSGVAPGAHEIRRPGAADIHGLPDAQPLDGRCDGGAMRRRARPVLALSRRAPAQRRELIDRWTRDHRQGSRPGPSEFRLVPRRPQVRAGGPRRPEDGYEIGREWNSVPVHRRLAERARHNRRQQPAKGRTAGRSPRIGDRRSTPQHPLTHLSPPEHKTLLKVVYSDESGTGGDLKKEPITVVTAMLLNIDT